MHTINITNFNSNEKITHSFAIIKGIIKNADINKCSKNCDNIALKNLKTNLILQSSLNKNCFKFLIELDCGLNEFVLTFCCVDRKFTLDLIEKQTDFVVTPLYIICEGHNGEFQAPITENNSTESACKRVTTGVKLLQCVIAEKLFEQNLGRNTFKLDRNCQIFNSKLPYCKARQMHQKDLWNYFARELINSKLHSENRKFLALLACTQFKGNLQSRSFLYEELLKQTEAYVALGAGGLALFGTACLYTWPENIAEVIPRFLNTKTVDSNYFMDDSCYR